MTVCFNADGSGGGRYVHLVLKDPAGTTTRAAVMWVNATNEIRVACG